MSLSSVVVVLQQMRSELQETAAMASAAADSVERLNEADAVQRESAVSRASGGGASTMGSSSGAPDGNAGMSKAVTAAGLKAALAVTRRRAQ